VIENFFVETLRRNCPAGIRRWALYLGWEPRLLYKNLDFSLPNTLSLTGWVPQRNLPLFIFLIVTIKIVIIPFLLER
jgi:hypothetical protein